MFMVELFEITEKKNWKNPKYPLRGMWISKMQYSHTMGTMKMNK